MSRFGLVAVTIAGVCASVCCTIGPSLVRAEVSENAPLLLSNGWARWYRRTASRVRAPADAETVASPREPQSPNIGAANPVAAQAACCTLRSASL